MLTTLQDLGLSPKFLPSLKGALISPCIVTRYYPSFKFPSKLRDLTFCSLCLESTFPTPSHTCRLSSPGMSSVKDTHTIILCPTSWRIHPILTHSMVPHYLKTGSKLVKILFEGFSQLNLSSPKYMCQEGRNWTPNPNSNCPL